MIKSLNFFTANLFKCLILQCVGGLKALVNMAMNLLSGIRDCVLYEVMLSVYCIHWNLLKLLYLRKMLKMLHSSVPMIKCGEECC